MLMNWFGSLWGLLMLGLLILSVYALVHAALQREDAYRAADKQTKPFWLVILGVSVAAQLILPGMLLLTLAGTVAAIVYIVDVKPAITGVGGRGGRGGGWSSSDGPYGPYNGNR
ncbi:DUF2516 family protein [Streptomyces carpaticus]|uniref:DUF2516 family protein n=1 Tax=Streptomyces TaxID=1883 RepID=UPI002202F06A|nr:DUF2516 family protein [Streptomyces carpaticus]